MARHGLDQLVTDVTDAERRTREAKAETEAVLSTLHCAANAEVTHAISTWNAGNRGAWRYAHHSTKITLIGADSPEVEIAVEIASVIRRSDGHALLPREAWDLREEDLVAGIRNHIADMLCMPTGCRLRVTLPMDFDPLTADPEL